MSANYTNVVIATLLLLKGGGLGGREASRVRLLKVPCAWWPIIAHKWKMPFLHVRSGRSSGKCLNGRYLKNGESGSGVSRSPRFMFALTVPSEWQRRMDKVEAKGKKSVTGSW